MTTVQFGRISFYNAAKKQGAIESDDGTEVFFRATDTLHDRLESQLQQEGTEDWQAIQFFKNNRLDVVFEPEADKDTAEGIELLDY